MRYVPVLVLAVSCGGSDPCGSRVQWAPFSVEEFRTLCEGDALEIRELNDGQYLVDLNVQFRGIDGSAAVAGEWSLRFDGELSTEDLVTEVASYDVDGWYRVHASLWLGQTNPVDVAELDGSEALLEARFSDPTGTTVGESLSLVTAAP